MAQAQAVIVEEADRQIRFSRCIGYRAIPDTPVGSLRAVAGATFASSKIGPALERNAHPEHSPERNDGERE